MKLILCSHCSDAFSPSYEIRSCFCGQVNGRLHDDSQEIVIEGPAQILAVDDLRLHHALAISKYSSDPVPLTASLHPRQPANGRIQPK
jgi:hypothetical protein